MTTPAVAGGFGAKKVILAFSSTAARERVLEGWIGRVRSGRTFRGCHPQLLHLAIKVRPVQAQQSRGLAHVAAGAIDGSLNVANLELTRGVT
jgi:hypothetical protein